MGSVVRFQKKTKKNWYNFDTPAEAISQSDFSVVGEKN